MCSYVRILLFCILHSLYSCSYAAGFPDLGISFNFPGFPDLCTSYKKPTYIYKAVLCLQTRGQRASLWVFACFDLTIAPSSKALTEDLFTRAWSGASQML